MITAITTTMMNSLLSLSASVNIFYSRFVADYEDDVKWYEYAGVILFALILYVVDSYLNKHPRFEKYKKIIIILLYLLYFFIYLKYSNFFSWNQT